MTLELNQNSDMAFWNILIIRDGFFMTNGSEHCMKKLLLVRPA